MAQLRQKPERGFVRFFRFVNFIRKLVKMENIRLKVSTKEAYKDLMEFLEKFDKNELEIIPDSDFETQKANLQKELEAIEKGNSDLMDIEEYDSYLEKVINEYED